MFVEKDCMQQRKKHVKHQRQVCVKIKTAGNFGIRREIVKTGLMVFIAGILICISVHTGEWALVQQNIASEVLRFHVLANSDSEEDQNVKYQVRDAVLAWLEEELASSSGSDAQKYEMEKMLKNHLREIEETADEVLKAAGMDYRAAAEVTRCYFPDRTYGSCTFAAGWYDALRIRLGEAKGQNWWCVLYPRLCFQDCLHAVIEEEQLQKLEEVLTVEEYESLFTQPQKWKLAFRWF